MASVALALMAVGCSGSDPPVALVDPDAWTEHRDCGYAFRALDPEGTQRLVVAPGPGAVVHEPTTIQLPSPAWRAHVDLGSHFGGRGWDDDGACTDLIDGEVAPPQVDERWEVFSGTLAIEPGRGPRGWPGAQLTATRLLAQKPNGDHVGLDTITVRSDCWGCTAG